MQKYAIQYNQQERESMKHYEPFNNGYCKVMKHAVMDGCKCTRISKPNSDKEKYNLGKFLAGKR